MTDLAQRRRNPAIWSLIFATATGLSGALVLIGWHFDIHLLKAPLPGRSYMVPTTALGLVLCSLSLAAQARLTTPRWLIITGRVPAVVVLVYAFTVLLEYAIGTDFGIDQKLFVKAVANWPISAYPGRFAPNTAFAFCLLSIALLVLGRKVGRTVIAEPLALIAGLTSFISLVGYLYHVEDLYSVGTQAQQALHTALAFAVLSAGVFLARSDMGSTQVLVSPHADGLVARRLLTVSFVMLLVLGWLALKAQKKELLDLESGTALLVVISVVAFAVLVMNTARMVRRFQVERERATHALIQSEKLASVGRMAATVAHEINNPLAAVTNAIYLVSLDPTLAPQTRAHVALAEEQLSRVAHLTRQTLGFYRETRAPSVFDAAELMESTLQFYQARIDQRKIQVRKRYGQNCAVWGVPGEMRQVIANLLANSMDALPAGGTLFIQASRCNFGNAPRVRLTVADNGAGISTEHREQIFQPFFTTKEKVGTGLGLWIAREIVTKQNGAIRFRSREGKGTVFSVFLPAQSAAEMNVRSQPVSAVG